MSLCAIELPAAHEGFFTSRALTHQFLQVRGSQSLKVAGKPLWVYDVQKIGRQGHRNHEEQRNPQKGNPRTGATGGEDPRTTGLAT